jgi:hypothetical protein
LKKEVWSKKELLAEERKCEGRKSARYSEKKYCGDLWGRVQKIDYLLQISIHT